MRKSLTLLTLIIVTCSYSQNLSLDEVINLRKKNIAQAEEFLTIKGWDLLESIKGDFYSMSKVSFAYKKSSYNDKAESFLQYFSSETSGENRLNLQVHRKEKYSIYLGRIKSLGCKLKNSEITSNGVKKIYQGATTTFVVSVSTQKEEYGDATSTIYNIFILSNIDYNENFTEKISDYNNIVDTVAVDSFAVSKIPEVYKTKYVGREMPIHSGTYIWDKPELENSKKIAETNSRTVYVIERTNENFYKVEVDRIKGYIHINSLR